MCGVAVISGRPGIPFRVNVMSSLDGSAGMHFQDKRGCREAQLLFTVWQIYPDFSGIRRPDKGKDAIPVLT